MSGEDKNKLDGLFKSGLDKPEDRFDFLVQDWDAMEQLLDAGKKPRGLVYWLPMLSGIAALLLIALGWWYFKPAAVEQKQQIAVHQPKAVQVPAVTKVIPAGKNQTLNSPGIANAPVPLVSHNQAVKGSHTTTIKSNPVVTVQSDNTPAPDNSNISSDNNVIAATNADNNAAKPGTDSMVAKANANAVAAANADKDVKNGEVSSSSANSEPVDKSKIKTSVQTIGNRRGPQFGLAVMVSPDINGVNSFQSAKIGTNVGMLFSVSFGKLSVSTGAAYSKKPYLTNFSNYHTSYVFPTDPSSVYADCRVLDIPLNIDYQVYHKARNSFSVGSGLSSYIMLKEKYSYDYSQPYISGPTNFTITNRNQHILGILNLDATYTRQVNSRLGIMAQPYMKIPLTNIGYSQVRLRSAGVALGLHWNINQSKTP
jgi:hypothetical protein